MIKIEYNESQLVTFKLDGPNLKHSVDLYDIITCLSEFHTIIDKSYCMLSGQQRLSKTDRSFFKIQASNFKQGSFLADLEILITGTTLALPLLGFTNPYTIWEYTKNSFSFLKAIYSARRKGDKPQIVTGDGSQIILITGDDNQITIPDFRIIELANRTKKNYSKLANTLTEDGVQEIQIFNNQSNNKGIYLSLPEKELFKTSTEIIPQPKSFHADIYDFNKETNSGKLKIFNEQSIPEGDYPFSVIGNQDNSKYIESMLHDRVYVTAKKRNWTLLTNQN